MRVRPLRTQRGQAMVAVLAFMVLSVPFVTSALAFSSALAVDSRIKIDLLKSQYSALGAQQFIRHMLVGAPGATTTVITINNTTVTSTVVKLLPPPGTVPFISPKGRLLASKTVTPTSAGTSTAVTYTITVLNTKDATLELTKIVDTLPDGFTYVSSTSVLKDKDGATVSTAEPSVKATVDDQDLTWTVPANTVLLPGETMTLAFQATTATTAGVYCNETYLEPGGWGVSTGKTAKVTVGSPTDLLCKGLNVSVSKTVTPSVQTGNTTTTYTYIIELVNEGTEAVDVTEIRDDLESGFTYVPLSVSSSPSSFASAISAISGGGEPTIDSSSNELTWTFATSTKLATSTTWRLQFEAKGTLDFGYYANTTEVELARIQWLGNAIATACLTSEGSAELTISNNDTVDCNVWSQNSGVEIGKTGTVVGHVISQDGEVEVKQNGTVEGNVFASGEINVRQDATIKGHVISGADVSLGQGAVVEGDVWTTGDVFMSQSSLARIHRRTPMDGVRKAEGGVRELQGK